MEKNYLDTLELKNEKKRKYMLIIDGEVDEYASAKRLKLEEAINATASNAKGNGGEEKNTTAGVKEDSVNPLERKKEKKRKFISICNDAETEGCAKRLKADGCFSGAANSHINGDREEKKSTGGVSRENVKHLAERKRKFILSSEAEAEGCLIAKRLQMDATSNDPSDSKKSGTQLEGLAINLEKNRKCMEYLVKNLSVVSVRHIVTIIEYGMSLIRSLGPVILSEQERGLLMSWNIEHVIGFLNGLNLSAPIGIDRTSSAAKGESIYALQLDLRMKCKS